jgi:hypothetical protein
MENESKEDKKQRKALDSLLSECRMVLPGIQALFGFQLISIFSQGFETRLHPEERIFHLVALVLVACAVALVMAPAACHRQAGSLDVSERLLRLASGLLLASMVPLGFATCIELYIVARVILGERILPILIASFMVGALATLWYVVPHIHARRGRTIRSREAEPARP